MMLYMRRGKGTGEAFQAFKALLSLSPFRGSDTFRSSSYVPCTPVVIKASSEEGRWRA